jgi:hypothetical protein
MTAGVLDFSGIGNWRWNSTNGTQQVSLFTKRMYDPPTATLGRENSYGRRADVLLRLLELTVKSPQVRPAAFARASEWLINLPEAIPNPFVAIGDDGSISTEWDAAGNSLHVTFEGDTEEVYFFSPTGEEWESSLDAVDKISSALRTIVLATSARR